MENTTHDTPETTPENTPEMTAEVMETIEASETTEADEETVEASETTETLEAELDKMSANILEDIESNDFEFELDFYDEKDQEDKEWQKATGMTYETLCGAIETLIFMSEKPITLTKLKSLLGEEIPLRVFHECIEVLQEDYEKAHHGIRLQEVAEGYQFRTKATYKNLVQRLFNISSFSLSPSTLEVLAIVAYKQPVSKTQIEKIRGVDCSHITRSLIEKKLIKIAGRSEEELGRPTLYTTTSEFLDIFNLKSIEDLPPEYELEEMAAINEVGNAIDIKEAVHMGEDKDRFVFDDMEELESLTTEIKSIASETEFIQALKGEDKKRIAGDSGEIKTAFEILEDCLVKNEVTEQNIASVLSENGVEGFIQPDTTETPEVLMSEEEFEESTDHYTEEEAALADALDKAWTELHGSKPEREPEADVEIEPSDEIVTYFQEIDDRETEDRLNH